MGFTAAATRMPNGNKESLEKKVLIREKIPGADRGFTVPAKVL